MCLYLPWRDSENPALKLTESLRMRIYWPVSVCKGQIEVIDGEIYK